jgi:hypothetical protein
MRLGQVPMDLLQESSAILEAYVRARRKSKLQEEQARLREELQDMNTDLAEIQALATHPARALTTCHKGVSGGVERNLEEPALRLPKGENHA